MDVAAIIIAAVTGYFALANNREQRKFDLKFRDMEFEVRDLKRTVDECHAERSTLRLQVAEQQAEINTLKATNARQQGEIDSLKRNQTAAGIRADSAEFPTPPASDE